jgi:membrane fusion protein, multidrug efflux system
MSTESSPTASQSHPRKHWSVWVAAVLILTGGGFLLSQHRTSSSSGGKGGKKGLGGPIPVSVTKVTKGNIGEYVNALGTVTPVYTVTVTSRVVGELTQVLYHEGQIVHKGDLLAVIDPRPYAAVLMQAQGQLSRDQALLKNALVDLHRYQEAYGQHAIPEQTLATQQATVEGNEGTVKLDEGNLAAAQVNVDYARITSPIDGRVGLRLVDPGNIVQANGTTGIATITQLQPITVIFTMAEDYISDVVGELRKGHKLKVLAQDRSDQHELAQGTLLTLDNQVDTTTGTVRVRSTFTNKNYELFPNEFVNARLLVRTLMGVNLVPTAAIQRNNEQAFVYVVNTDNSTVQSRNIKVATTDGDTAAVTGIAPGETLVTNGFDRLINGAHVHIRTGAAGESTDEDENEPTDDNSDQATGAPSSPAANAPSNNQSPASASPTTSPSNGQPNQSQSPQAQQGAANQQISGQQQNAPQGKGK